MDIEIPSEEPRPAKRKSPLNLVTLICKAHIPMALKCLSSLMECCQFEKRLVVYEDGTLSDEDVTLMEERFPGCILVRREEVDDKVARYLTSAPNCRKHRAKNATMLKVIDIPITMTEPFLFWDCDILFFRKFTLGAFTALGRDTFVFMRDAKIAYSGRPYKLAFKHRLPMPERLNSGVMSIPLHRYDFEYVEWFLGVEDFVEFPSVVEQTIWAAMTQNRDVTFVDPGQVYNAIGEFGVTDETVAIHFPSYYKERLEKNYEKAGNLRAVSSPSELRFNRPGKLGIVAVVANAVRNRRSE